jgi:hypothetical protein
MSCCHQHNFINIQKKSKVPSVYKETKGYIYSKFRHENTFLITYSILFKNSRCKFGKLCMDLYLSDFLVLMNRKIKILGHIFKYVS